MSLTVLFDFKIDILRPIARRCKRTMVIHHTAQRVTVIDIYVHEGLWAKSTDTLPAHCSRSGYCDWTRLMVSASLDQIDALSRTDNACALLVLLKMHDTLPDRV